MSGPRRDGNRIEHHDTAVGYPRARTEPTGAAPTPDVVEAAEFLLAEPDAHLYRRRYLELLAHRPGPGGTSITDYTAAEQYLLVTAARRRKAIQRQAARSAVETPDLAEDDAPASADR